jgi:biopolymer transport protein ExbB/TolQ
MDLSKLSSITQLAGDLCYLFLAVDALWGLYCVVVLWRRLRQAKFADEAEQNRYLDQWEANLNGDPFAAGPSTERDERVVAQLGRLAVENQGTEPVKLRHLLADRFQRDFSSDLEYRMSWVNTVIKTAPMLGLFGTVLGMMSAFGKLGSGSKVDPAGLASDISLALITTAIGLAIAIPLSMAVAALAIRIRKTEDLINAGLSRMLDIYTFNLRAAAGRRKG